MRRPSRPVPVLPRELEQRLDERARLEEGNATARELVVEAYRLGRQHAAQDEVERVLAWLNARIEAQEREFASLATDAAGCARFAHSFAGEKPTPLVFAHFTGRMGELLALWDWLTERARG